ncbi:MAG: hypothetical protein C5B59_03535 [Bacteroidetes bacterium]|nr:MAG: hypothetical protein C5B59_03535 [Bacteroidota bacterium]
MSPDSIYYLFESGRKRKQEDYIWPIPGKATVNDRVFIVCDGTGSFDGGEIASKLICEFMAAKVMRFPEYRMSEELINNLLTEARDRLISYAREYRLDTDMATTFSMLILYDQKVFMTWFGDSRIYHLRNGEILFRTKNDYQINELVQEGEKTTAIVHSQPDNSFLHAITADSSPIYAETKWIEDVRNGDYFLVCSKGLLENVSDEDIKSLLSQTNPEQIDPVDSLKQMSIEKTQDNYSMYLIRVNLKEPKKVANFGIPPDEKKGGFILPRFVLALTVIGALLIFFYFRKKRNEDSSIKYTSQPTQPVSAPRLDSVTRAIITSEPQETVPMVTDPVKSYSKGDGNSKPPPTVKVDSTIRAQAPRNEDVTDKSVEETEKEMPAVVSAKKLSGQFLIKFTTDESCTLRIANMDTEEVIDWDLSGSDIEKIYLKPGNYSIVATSVNDGTKAKTYHFDVKPRDANKTQNIHITF